MAASNERLLTKSRFKLGLECVTKLYYTGKKKEYADEDLDDPFLKTLAEYGFQVGELAKYYFCEDPVLENITITERKYDESVAETKNRLANKGKVVIAEAAFRYNNLFIRSDIIIKEGNKIDLYEVKAKSFNGDEKDGNISDFLSHEGKPNESINKGWVPYLYDLAFQKYVMQNALPGFIIRAHLLMANKDSTATIDGLNQKLRIVRDDGRASVQPVAGLKASMLGEPILKEINLDDIIDKIYNKYEVPTDWKKGVMFKEFVEFCEKIYLEDKRVYAPIGAKCKGCQFFSSLGNPDGLKSGFHECWKHNTGFSDELLSRPLVIELWGGLAGSISLTQNLIESGVFLLDKVEETMITPKSSNNKKEKKPGLLPIERRMEQVNRVKEKNGKSYFDKKGMEKEMKDWKYPLHMIDFETSMAALPFLKGLKPYEGIAFQFSHHILNEDGTVEHKGQFLEMEVGRYPNYNFVRALKKELENDEGSVFRYHYHENSYLNMIMRQLMDPACKINDRDELIAFIKTITRRKIDGKSEDAGNREMIDLWDLVLRYYYSPATKGSNSLKQVLPAIINDSKHLKDTYGKAGYYGKNLTVKSKNFDDHVWIQENKNNDPYKTLPEVFSGHNREELDNLVKDLEGLADGGAALTAYNYLQFSSVPEMQRQDICNALLRYCELDTLAMVMIVEGWKHWE